MIQLNDEEYHIYSLIIISRRSFTWLIGDVVKRIMIKENTDSGQRNDNDKLDSSFIEIMPELQQETIDDFNKANQESYLLEKRFNLPVDYTLISKEEFHSIFPNPSGWFTFYKKYPGTGGIITLSRVGFNTDKNQALVYIGIQAAPETGAGTYILLIKENNTWKIKSNGGGYIS